jgi:hypothetical protein
MIDVFKRWNEDIFDKKNFFQETDKNEIIKQLEKLFGEKK